MSKVIKYWCDSGANAFSCREGEITFEELGVSETEWEELSEDEQTELMRDIACDRLDWGFNVQDSE